MKALILALAALASQAVLASDTNTFVRDFERNNGVKCQYTQSSKLEYCLNSLCIYKQYYACSNDQKELTLVLKVRSVQFPGEPAEKSVIGHEVY